MVVLVIVNGLLAMSELAVVSSRPARLKAMEERNVPGAAKALALASNPGRFLSSFQIGITLVGILSGAFSGATLGDRLATLMAKVRIPEVVDAEDAAARLADEEKEPTLQEIPPALWYG